MTDTLFINLGYLDIEGCDFIEKRQPQKDEVTDIYLQKIENFQDIEKKFTYLDRFGNEVLTKTHPNISAKELLADKGILLNQQPSPNGCVSLLISLSSKLRYLSDHTLGCFTSSKLYAGSVNISGKRSQPGGFKSKLR